MSRPDKLAEMEPRHLIVFAVDGLRATPIGAYGGAAATPAIDRFASRSLLSDWCFAEAPEIDRAYASWWDGSASLTSSRHATLLVDGGVPIDAEAAGFHEVEVFSEPAADTPADTISDTWLAARLGEFADALGRAGQRAGSQCVWMHTKGFFAPWDAPTSVAQAMLDEDDAPLDPSAAPVMGTVTADEPDAPFLASCRYGAQLQVFDACFGGLVEVVEELFAEETYKLVLLGARGYALGEHGVIGPDDRLYAETLHVPLIIGGGDALGAMSRVGSVVGASSLASLLAGDPSGSLPHVVRQSSGSGAKAVQREEWRLIEPAAAGDSSRAPQLYLKPDDRWEANDVASLLPDVVAEMQPLLAAPVGMAASGDSK